MRIWMAEMNVDLIIQLNMHSVRMSSTELRRRINWYLMLAGRLKRLHKLGFRYCNKWNIDVETTISTLFPKWKLIGLCLSYNVHKYLIHR